MVGSVAPDLVLESHDSLEIYLPDRAESDVEVWAGNDGFEAYGYAAAGHWWASFPGIGTFRFPEDAASVVAVPDPGVSAQLVEDAYHRNVLPLLLHLRGYEALHASAVGTASGVLALCGVSGTGKSTFAHALSERGYGVWADDAVVLDLQGEEVGVLRVPFRLRLDEATATFFASHPAASSAPDGEPSRSALRALAILSPSEDADALVVDIARLAAADAFTALLPHAYYFRLSEPSRNALMVERYLRLAASVPTFEIRYRRGLRQIAAVLDAIEQRILTG